MLRHMGSFKAGTRRVWRSVWPGLARRRIAIAAAMLVAVLATHGAEAVDDPYAWLEDVHGTKALDWVKAQNEHSVAVLKSDPDYRRDYDAMLAILDATDRIPYGSVD